MFTTGPFDLTHHGTTAGHNQRNSAGFRDGGGDIHGSAFDPAGFEHRQYLKDNGSG
jgi:hypothetical protein